MLQDKESQEDRKQKVDETQITSSEKENFPFSEMSPIGSNKLWLDFQRPVPVVLGCNNSCL